MTFTAQGNAAPTTTQSNFYGGSYTFDGSTDRLFTNIPNGDALYLQGSNFTVECWVRLASGQTDDRYMIHIANGTASNANGSWQMRINASKFNPGFTESSTQYNLTSTENYIPNKWTHVAFVREGNQQRLYIDGILDATTSYTQTPNNLTSGQLSIGGVYDNGDNSINGQIQDVRIYDGVAKYTSNFIPASTDPDILPDTPSGVAGGSALTSIPDSATEGAVAFDNDGSGYLRIDRDTNTDFEFGTGSFTIEAWVYMRETGDNLMSTTDNGNYTTGGWLFESDGQFRIAQNGGTYESWGTFSYPFGRWFHVAVTRDGSTYYGFIDGVQQWTGSTSFNNTFGSTNDLAIGASRGGTSGLGSYEAFLNGAVSNVRIVKGTAVYTSNFTPPTTPLTNITNTVLLCCQSTTSATASAVNPGTLEVNGTLSATKFSPFLLSSNINAVRGQESGYCTLNPVSFGPSNADMLEGNLRFNQPTASTGNAKGTIAVSSGKWYWEVTPQTTTTANVAGGILGAAETSIASQPGEYATGYAYLNTGERSNNSTETSYGATYGAGDVIGTALDLDAGTLVFYKNGISQGTAFSGLSGTFVPAIGDTSTGSSSALVCNFGQKPFKYAPPEGFKTLCLANLPRPTSPAAVRPDKYFGTVLYNGDGGTNNTVSGLSFTPDFVWGKCRTGDASLPHNIFDVVRGFDRQLVTNDDTVEVDRAGDAVTPLSNGFILDATYCNINNSSTTNVAWCWKAGGAAVTNNDGSAASQVSANRDSGFSIVTYTGQSSNFTWGHGLGVAPSMVWIKRRSNSAAGWSVYHKSLGATKRMQLNQEIAEETMAYFQNTAPTDTVFSVTTNGGVGADGETYVAYCWSEVPGFSKFGSYTGNGNADGPFIHLGFRPAWVMWKQTNTDNDRHWVIRDSVRDVDNPTGQTLYASTNGAEQTLTSQDVDFLSNGFKIRSTWDYQNASSRTYIYAAYAEAPTQNLYGGQANAR